MGTTVRTNQTSFMSIQPSVVEFKSKAEKDFKLEESNDSNQSKKCQNCEGYKAKIATLEKAIQEIKPLMVDGGLPKIYTPDDLKPQ